jgi:hypothetical protein
MMSVVGRLMAKTIDEIEKAFGYNSRTMSERLDALLDLRETSISEISRVARDELQRVTSYIDAGAVLG